jgi:hypothetical protein
MDMTRNELTSEQIRDILCVPEPTDDIKDIDFDEDFNEETEEAERQFIEESISEWLEEKKNA